MTTVASTPRELKALYPYQFTEPLISESYPRGWFPIFARLCAAIDGLLAHDKRGFKWRQVKEKQGAARFYYTLGFFGKDSDDPEQGQYVRTFKEERIAEEIALVVRAASHLTSHTCVVCGQAGTIQSHEGYELAVCDAHHAQWLAGRWVQDFYLGDGLDQ